MIMVKKNKIHIPVKGQLLQGYLNVPFDADSLVIFSHGSGRSRFSSRNRYIAETLNKENIATLLTDLLTETEDIFANRFNIDLLTGRLADLTEYVRQIPELNDLPIGYFGTSTGAACALQAAAKLGDSIHAVVSRGGRPDLAQTLIQVNAPTLLIAGSFDPEVVALNEEAYLLLRCKKKMEIVDGASHLFEEPGKLNEFTELSTHWFKKYLLNSNSVLHTVQ